VKGYIRRTADEHRTSIMLAQQCLHVARRSYSRMFGQPTLELSSFRGRAVPRASRDSNRSLGALFVFSPAVCLG
jgi:hypothetical protein